MNLIDFHYHIHKYNLKKIKMYFKNRVSIFLFLYSKLSIKPDHRFHFDFLHSDSERIASDQKYHFDLDNELIYFSNFQYKHNRNELIDFRGAIFIKMAIRHTVLRIFTIDMKFQHISFSFCIYLLIFFLIDFIKIIPI